MTKGGITLTVLNWYLRESEALMLVKQLRKDGIPCHYELRYYVFIDNTPKSSQSRQDLGGDGVG